MSERSNPQIDNRFRNSDLSDEERVDILMIQMSLEEKVGQLGSIWLGFGESKPDEEKKSQTDNVPVIDEVSKQPSWEDATRHGLGHFTRVFGTKPIDPAEGVKKVIQLQKRLISETRLSIPATVHEECLTGFATKGATTFPTPLALAATFNPVVIESVGEVIGRDMRAAGVHHALAPVMDLVRDYRWGRVEETFGEDPYLAAVCGAAYVKGIQDQGVIATLKHFAGHSSSRAARNHGPVSMGWREMYDFMIPPFELSISETKVGSVMNSYTDVDGEPCGSSPRMLTELLRNELGFQGVVVSDYWSISFLELMHRVAGSPKEAGILALKAGIDVELPSTRCYGDNLVSAVRSGEIDESYVNTSCRRVLLQKVRQGLLDDGWTPEGDVKFGTAEVDFDTQANRAIAKAAAAESIVLLENRGILPLRLGIKNIALIGPCADDGAAFLGCYSFANHVMSQYPGSGMGIEVPTLLSALRKLLPESQIGHAAGVPVKHFDTSGISAAEALATQSDLAILVVGDRAGLFGEGTSGEGNDVADLKLPGAQQELLDSILATGTDCIVISVSGRPYTFGPNIDKAKGVIQAFMPGEEGGVAIAELLVGMQSPKGRLPVEIPAASWGQPSTYLQPKYGQPGLGMTPVDSIAKYPFGHGLTYTTFEYSNLVTSNFRPAVDEIFEISFEVKNTGSTSGVEVSQVYFSDPVASVARPVIQLLGFARVELSPGQSKKITMEIHPDRLAYISAEYSRVVDPGKIELAVGSSKERLILKTEIELQGNTRKLGSKRELRTQVSIG